MEDDIFKVIKDKAETNIGALSGFLRSKRNIEYYNYLINNINVDYEKYDLTISQMVYYLLNDISEPLVCICGKHRKFIGYKNGYRESCGDKECYVKKREETCLKKYGVRNPQMNEDIVSKTQKTVLERYNGKHFMYDENVRQKFNTTMKERYGTEWAMQNDDIKDKSFESWSNKSEEELEHIKQKRIDTFKNKTDEDRMQIQEKKVQTIIEKFGSYEIYLKHVSDKTRETSLERYGTEHFMSSDDIISKRVESYKQTITNKIIDKIPEKYHLIERTTDILKFRHDICDQDFDIHRLMLKNRIDNNKELCTICNKINSAVSQSEKDVYNYISSIYDGEIIGSYKTDKYEIDIYLPELKIGFEYNGLYWHNELYRDKNYHISKTKYMEENGIHLIHIYEDQWFHKQDIVKSRIDNILGKNSNIIYARKCEIKELKDVNNFLEDNHIQGKVRSKIKLGLYYHGDLVSVMTFGSYRKNMGKTAEKDKYELLRFCNKKGYSVVGGASKLYKYFIRAYNPSEIISYADRSWTNIHDNLYIKLGLEYVKETIPNYYYIDSENILRLNRFGFRKDILVKEGYDKDLTEREIMFNRGIYRIYDSGSLLYKHVIKRLITI